MATLTAPLPTAIDVDLLGPALVAEIEAYLASLPTPAATAPATKQLPGLTVPVIPQHGSVVQAWHASVDRPEPTILERLRGRHPVAQVTAAQHLNLVSRYIHAHGWLQGALWNQAGAVCILGAQLQVLAAGYSTPAVVEQARLLIGNQLGYQRQGMPIDTWNDQVGRTAAEVHQMLRAAAARAR